MKCRMKLIPIALLCSVLFFAGFTKAKANEVQVGISLPYSGNYNNWTIQFYDGGILKYEFNTDNSTFNSQVLGMVEEGTYEIEFYCQYSGWFDLGVVGPTYYHFELGQNGHQYWGAKIEEGSYIQIDKFDWGLKL